MAILMPSPRDQARYVSTLGSSYLRLEVYAWLGERMAHVPADAELIIVGTGGGFEEPWIGGRRYRTLDINPKENADITADICNTGLPTDSLPCLILSQVLEHLPDPAAAIQECRRVLQSGGHLLVTVPWDYPCHRDKGTCDYWRISDDGLRYLLKGWEVLNLERRTFGSFAHARKVVAA